jgi:nucleoid-associated protein YgaU
MSERSAATARKVLAVGLAVGLSAAAVAVLWHTTLGRPPGPAERAGAPEAVATAPDGNGTKEIEAEATTEATETATGATDGADAAQAPSFDVVRVSPDGQALVAGRAEPGATVTIYAGEEKLATVEAGPSGEFVAIFRADPSDSPRALTVDARQGSGPAVASDQVVMLLPPSPPAAPDAGTAGPAVVRGRDSGAGGVEPREGAVGEPAGASAGSAAAEAEAGGAAEATVAAAAVLRPDEPAEVRPTGEARRTGQVTISSISYAEEGGVTLEGLAEAGASVRAYVDDAFAESAVADAEGQWALKLDGVEAGVYRLRIDAIGDDGRVASRVETPFQRDYPDVAEPGAARPVSVTVQPGHNLWTLARAHYGQGVLYSKIYTANAEMIRNPDLIYPGQIFDLPELGPDEAAGVPWRPGDGPRARP